MGEPAEVVAFPQSERPQKSKLDRSLTQRWKHEALFSDGYVGVPVAFLHLYAHLNPPLTPGEALFVIHLMQFKWSADAPWPSYRKISGQMGVSDKMARRHAQSLELKGYLKREERTGLTNKFELTPLFDALFKAQQSQPTEKR